ncbi:MAG: hypothetical protein VXY26_03450 [Bacteroidota bacterium]|nr:hypothetical protein [Bacteroidota bacterium]
MKKSLIIFFCFLLIFSSCQKKHISVSKVDNNFYNVKFHNGANFNIGKKWVPLIQIADIQQEYNDWRFAIKMLNTSKNGFFAANLYSESFIYGKQLTALMNLRLYPEGLMNEETNMLYSQNDVSKMDEIALSNMNDIFLTTVKMVHGDRLLEWKGTKKEIINDKYYLVCNYMRESMHDNTNKFNVKLYKLFDEKKSLTLTVSYKDITHLKHKMESVRNDIANSLKYNK